MTLAGSTRFKDQFEEVDRMLTLNGSIVLSLSIFSKTEDKKYDHKTEKELFDLQLDKILMSSGLFVIDVGGYIGESTKKEIEFAVMNGKFIKYYSKEVEGK